MMNVDMEKLTATIELARKNINEQPDYDKFNEARTREAIVAPILGAIGCNVADFSLVDVEYSVHGGEGRRKVDYALWGQSAPRSTQQDKPVTLLEAKGVDQNLDEESVVRSIRHYAFESGVSHVVLTNGKIWQAHVFPSGVLADHHQITAPVDIYTASNSPHNCAKGLVAMFEQVIATSSDHHISSGWVSLEDYLKTRRKSRVHPNAIRFLDGDERTVNHIRDLMKETADWLSAGNLLTADNCPLHGKGNTKKLLVSTDHSYSESAGWHTIGTSGLFVHIGEKGNADDVQDLLEGCRQSPADLYVQVAR